MFQRSYYLIFLLSCLFSACDHAPKKFKRLSETKTGIDFQNTLVLSDSFNILEFDYIYNGGGVAVADFNNDSLPDLFFTGNQVSSELYLNRGQLQFEKVTESAGVKTTTWVEGVTVVDINNDGLLDLYISASGGMYQDQHANLLFVNQGANKDGEVEFLEQAHQYGIDDTGYNTQAAFLDYDLDGDLDLYVLSNALENFNRNTTRPRKKNGSGKSTDKLYRNDAGYFTDISSEAGILIEGYGLGVVVQDFNKDGWPDIYVANDFISNDLLYINQKNGTFSNQIADQMRHQSHNGMGVDAADFNNDGYSDVLVLDMLPETNARQKSMMSPFANYDRYMLNLQMGYEPQYVRNTLQVNLGNGFFSEIGQLSGVHQTDWSWSPMFADLDNDGLKDLFVSNGYGKDITDMDYISYSQSLRAFGSAEARIEAMKKEIDNLEEIKLTNYLFQNKDDYIFENKSDEWGIEELTLSNGAICADLDNDGDLDLVVNNVNDFASVYENQTITAGAAAHFLKVKLIGNDGNKQGLGSKIYVYEGATKKESVQYHEHYLTRGYKSSADPIVHFGVGDRSVIDSLVVVWPDGRKQKLERLAADQYLTLNYSDAKQIESRPSNHESPLFHEVTDKVGIAHEHVAPDFVDFKQQPLLPHKHSENGPGLAVGDVNNDGLDDFFVGGSVNKPGEIFIQKQTGQFIAQPLLQPLLTDDMGAVFFDADNDGDDDLYVVSGGSRFPAGDIHYQDRLFINDGRGNFLLSEMKLPALRVSGSVVTAADFDGDHDLDLFVGGRVVPHGYPSSPQNVLLENRGGHFVNATKKYSDDFDEIGMVTAALWTDYDHDGRVDLLVAGEWMPVTFLHQKLSADGQISFEKAIVKGLEKSHGWWNSAYGADFDNDGDVDYVLGNTGLNSRLKASVNEPVSIYSKDFDGNGEIDPVMFYYNNHEKVPVASRDLMISQIAGIKGRFIKYKAYGEATFDQFFRGNELDGAQVLEVYELSSCLLKNNGNGQFDILPLPIEVQFAPVCGIEIQDFNHDGNLDMMLIGNAYGTELMTGRYDASYGSVLLGKGDGTFDVLKNKDAGVALVGDAKALISLRGAKGERLLISSQNKGPVKVHCVVQLSETRTIRPPEFAFAAEVVFNDGSRSYKELYRGGGYLSQTSRTISVPMSAERAVFYGFDGGIIDEIQFTDHQVIAQLNSPMD